MIIPILLYHSVTDDVQPSARDYEIKPGLFREHLGWFKENGFHPLSITEVAKFIHSGSVNLPQRPLVITFDDGYKNFLTDALPILAEFGFPATLYITSGYVGRQSGWLDPRDTRLFDMLSWEEIRECVRRGIEIGAHSHTHQQLDIISSNKAGREIKESKACLEEQLGVPIQSFAFPHGFYTKRLISTVKAAGFTSCCIVGNSIATTESDVFMLPRLNVNYDVSMDGIVNSVHHLNGKAKVWKETLRTGYRLARFGMQALKGAHTGIVDSCSEGHDEACRQEQD